MKRGKLGIDAGEHKLTGGGEDTTMPLHFILFHCWLNPSVEGDASPGASPGLNQMEAAWWGTD